jgi:hypothetical protein
MNPQPAGRDAAVAMGVASRTAETSVNEIRADRARDTGFPLWYQARWDYRSILPDGSGVYSPATR